MKFALPYEKLPHQPGVYSLTCSITDKTYVGATATSLRKAYLGHYNRLTIGGHRCKALQEDYDRYGDDAFVFTILEITSPEEVSARKAYWSEHTTAERYDKGRIGSAQPIYHCLFCNAPVVNANTFAQIRRFGHCKQCKPRPAKVNYTCPHCGSPTSRQGWGHAKRLGRCIRTCHTKEHRNDTSTS